MFPRSCVAEGAPCQCINIINWSDTPLEDWADTPLEDEREEQRRDCGLSCCDFEGIAGEGRGFNCFGDVVCALRGCIQVQ